MHSTYNHSAARQPLLGGMLITLAVLSLFAMLHHPVAHSSGAQSHSEAMVRIADLARLVHGALIATMTLSLVLLGEFARLKVQRAAWMRAGFIVYLIGTLMLSGAALINGFAVPALAESAAANAVGVEAAYALAWQFNQALSAVGTIALAAGMVIWSMDLVRATGLTRLTGAYGILVGSGLALALAGGWLHLKVPGMLLALVLLAIWQVAAGVLLLRK